MVIEVGPKSPVPKSVHEKQNADCRGSKGRKLEGEGNGETCGDGERHIAAGRT
jgi:hypothetical protein